MKFWAAVVEPAQTVKVEVEDGFILHVSQISLGEIKKEKGNESISVFLTVETQKLVLSTLFTEKLPQQQIDLVLTEEFELSHSWKNGTVFFYGYKTESPFEDEDDEFDSAESDSDEDIAITRPEDVKPEIKAKEEKPVETKKIKGESGTGKQKVKIVEPSPVKTDDDDESSDEDYALDGSTEEDEDDSDSEGDDSDDGEKEETPKKVESSKKRAASPATTETPKVKKAKLITPQKTEGKKTSGSVHIATPYPSKQTGKTPAANMNPQTPKPAGSHPCKSCNKTFNSEVAVASHTKDKHSAGK